MGMAMIFSSSSSDYSVGPPNPSPTNFKIEMINQVNNNVVAMINYPDCTNFEGNKICIFTNTTVDNIKSATSIDPHFTIDKKSPFARFTPTKMGWITANKIAEEI